MIRSVDSSRVDDVQSRVRQAEARINPDAQRSQSRPDSANHAPSRAETDRSTHTRDAEKNLLQGKNRFDDVLAGKNHLQAQQHQDQTKVTLRDDATRTDKQPGNTYTQMMDQTTRLSDAQVVYDRQKQVSSNQNIRWDNAAHYGREFRSPATQDLAVKNLQATQDVHRFTQQAPVGGQEAASYLRFLKPEQMVRLFA